MLLTDISMTINGITSCCSFDNHKALYAFMCKENIDKCYVYATLASLQITEPVEVTREDLVKVINS